MWGQVLDRHSQPVMENTDILHMQPLKYHDSTGVDVNF